MDSIRAVMAEWLNASQVSGEQVCQGVKCKLVRAVRRTCILPTADRVITCYYVTSDMIELANHIMWPHLYILSNDFKFNVVLTSQRLAHRRHAVVHAIDLPLKTRLLPWQYTPFPS